MGKIWGSSLERKTPLRRSAFMRSKRPSDPNYYRKPPPTLERKEPMRKVSKKQAGRLREYNAISKEFLSRFDRRYCEICLCVSTGQHLDDIRLIMGMSEEQSERALASMGARLVVSTETHHAFGRAGSLLTDPRGFVASGFECRLSVHENIRESRRLGLICAASDWCRPAALDEKYPTA